MSAESGIHISLSAETVFSVGDFAISNSMVTSTIVSIVLILFAFLVNKNLRNSSRPSGLQNFAEWIVESLYNLVHGVTNSRKKSSHFFPLIATFFLFIVLNNWVSILPGVGSILVTPKHIETSDIGVVDAYAAGGEGTIEEVAHELEKDVEHLEEEALHEAESHSEAIPIIRPGTADINTTLALAIISVLASQVFGFAHLNLGYLKKFINFSSPIMFVVGLLELISEFAKIISFAFRLFGNLFAGEVLLTVILSLVPVIVPLPFYGLELFVGFIQALVFAMLSLVFFNMATMGHDDH